MGGKAIIFAYGKRSNGYITCQVDFEVKDTERDWFKKDLDVYERMILNDLTLNNYIFELGRFCGKNNYVSILVLLSMEVPGRLIIELPQLASLNIKYYEDLKEFLRTSLGFEIK